MRKIFQARLAGDAPIESKPFIASAIIAACAWLRSTHRYTLFRSRLRHPPKHAQLGVCVVKSADVQSGISRGERRGECSMVRTIPDLLAERRGRIVAQSRASSMRNARREGIMTHDTW
jgi:hypothetical protein